MSNILLYLCRNHWRKYFRKLLYILGCLIFLAPSQPFDDYHNQQFELFYESENVIIWHSRDLNITDEYGLMHKIREYRKWEEKGKFKKRVTIAQ